MNLSDKGGIALQQLSGGIRRRKGREDGPDRTRPSSKVGGPTPSSVSPTSNTLKLSPFKASQGPLPDLPESDKRRPLTARLWLQSRLQVPDALSPSIYRTAGEDRPVTWANIKLAVQIVPLLYTPLMNFFWEDLRFALLAYLFRQIVKGILPASRMWAQSRMLDLVQKSFQGGPIDSNEVFWAAGVSLFLTASRDIYTFLTSHTDKQLRNNINHVMERAYMEAQLSLSIPSMSSPYIYALLTEAGVFAGFHTRSHRDGGTSMNRQGPFQTVSTFFSTITRGVEVITQLILLVRTLSGLKGMSLTPSSALLVFLSFAPIVFRVVGNWVFRDKHRRGQAPWFKHYQTESVYKDMASKGDYKQEVVLFGLKDWVLTRWDSIRKQHAREQEKLRQMNQGITLGLGIGQHGVETAFYVLLALQVFKTNLSLGSIRLYQETVSALVDSYNSLSRTLEEVFQSVFYLAAFCEATSDPEAIELAVRRGRRTTDEPLIDYEKIRTDEGMSIVARNLGFTYPGSERPVLHNVSLTLLPGQTLAIVGFNGGGKTTLVKALMGLYDHTGELLINGVEEQDIDPNTLHKRTSCLFQDFSRYSMTLRENVGIGNVNVMKDDETIDLAIERGGAEKVRDKVGLDGKLDRAGVPDAAQDGGRSGTDNVQEEQQEMMVGPPPGDGPGRGGPGGRGGGGGGLSGIGSGSGRGRGPPGGGDGPPPGPPPSGPPPGDMGDMPPPPGMIGKSAKDKVKDKNAALSGGQWQRVALARAFLRSDQSDLVVFDEPSASLDPRAEAELFQRIHALSTSGGRRATTIYISHRFSTVRKADKIAVVEDGTIAEIGSHSELMARNGRYAELFNLQKEGYEE